MGLIERLLTVIFGGGGNIIRETAEVFLPNAEAGEVRSARMREAALQQFAAEFAVSQRGLFDRIMDGINRLPRPALALGTLCLFLSAMFDPVWFAARMAGIALVPEPLWWLLGVIVSFYFGARHQAKGFEFNRALALTLTQAPRIAREIRALEAEHSDAVIDGENPALREWLERGR